ncbi:CtsR family transcriptional regulator [Clostridium oryzae]|uniref:Transcriptional regulator CtsR n=1 Tax=Clostridium oryzae TaxID=1450648 RepID=A0A1V4IMA1_9CLOT|nr:CtsR family transcriptional regulator [Clostridium oryzae]OPJ61046.1 transcriptional regulator CtsR [Clostridium oryzae]
MARLSDTIEQFIKALLEDNTERELMIQRNELANHFSCAPSQINYVLTTRFTSDKGYFIESKRGGGGCIIIKKVECSSDDDLLEIIMDKIGDYITNDKAIQIISGLLESGLISDREASLMKVATNNRILALCENINKVRADMLKTMIMVIWQ